MILERLIASLINLYRKLALVIFVAALSSALAQNITLECLFFDQWNGYECYLDNITVLEIPENVTFTGQHLPNRTNADVDIVQVANSNMPVVIPQIFETFSNVSVLYI